jgi:uncharacterized RDD family membrane protein YckC
VASLPPSSKAGPWPRFGARFVDGLVLVIPILVVTVPIAGGFQIGTTNNGAEQFVASALGVALSYGYFVIMEATRGSTVGKAAFSIEVRAASGRPTVEQTARRNSWMLLSIIPGTLGGLLGVVVAIALGVSISRDPAGRGFHDRFAGVVLDRN